MMAEVAAGARGECSTPALAVCGVVPVAVVVAVAVAFDALIGLEV